MGKKEISLYFRCFELVYLVVNGIKYVALTLKPWYNEPQYSEFCDIGGVVLSWHFKM